MLIEETDYISKLKKSFSVCDHNSHSSHRPSKEIKSASKHDHGHSHSHSPIVKAEIDDNDENVVREDPITIKEKRALRAVIKQKKAKFNFKTTDILRSIFSCVYFLPRSYLRTTASRRVVLNYKLGLEKVDKSLDISNIVLKLRQLNFFMKMMLQRDHRKLLKLRGSQFIASDLDYDDSIFKVKKCMNKEKMLNLIVDNIRGKKMELIDIKLLQQAGLNDVIQILKIREDYQMKIRGLGNSNERPESEMWKDGIIMEDLLDIVRE